MYLKIPLAVRPSTRGVRCSDCPVIPRSAYIRTLLESRRTFSSELGRYIPSQDLTVNFEFFAISCITDFFYSSLSNKKEQFLTPYIILIKRNTGIIYLCLIFASLSFSCSSLRSLSTSFPPSPKPPRSRASVFFVPSSFRFCGGCIKEVDSHSFFIRSELREKDKFLDNV